eukprot:TRINITY_DN22851_c0_g5_i1.p1 TRINITY_DN22851_c0_g5~~TRINITY_DN22851_c0_g5_i1.p1  ORF type:complete len:522 (-),score=87.82 TRINITY_DN22851_c0_g5_i1:41-1606(-)
MGLSDFLFCRCLGDRICGMDLDRTFAYQTPKVVKIQDRTLGLVRIGLMLAIFVYIVVFNMWYKGEHFLMSDINGVFRLQWQEPVAGQCNPLNLKCNAKFHATTELPYCTDFTGPALEREKDVKDCAFYDAQELAEILLGGVLIPTRIKTFKQVRTCQEESESCMRKFSYVDAEGNLQEGDGKATPISDNFVVDVEDFTVLIDHAFSTENGKVKLDDYKMQGYWKPCPGGGKHCERKKMSCEHESCASEAEAESEAEATTMFTNMRAQRAEGHPDWRGHHHHVHMLRGSAPSFAQLSTSTESESLENTTRAGHIHRGGEHSAGSHDVAARKGQKVASIDDGDVFSLRTLLAMAGTSIDDVVDTEDLHSHSVRDRGTAIVVTIAYNNMHHWQLLHPQSPPEYTVSVTKRPVKTFKQSSQSEVVKEDEEGRILQIKYGVFVMVQQTGRIGTFDIVSLLITLAAGTTLMAMSNVATDMLALYLLPKKGLYTELKYQMSEAHLGSASAKAYDSDSDAGTKGARETL